MSKIKVVYWSQTGIQRRWQKLSEKVSQMLEKKQM